MRRVGATWFVTRPQPLTLLFLLWSMCVICLVLVCKSGNLIDYWSFQTEVHCITCGGHLVFFLSSATFMTYVAAFCVSFLTLSLFASCISLGEIQEYCPFLDLLQRHMHIQKHQNFMTSYLHMRTCIKQGHVFDDGVLWQVHTYTRPTTVATHTHMHTNIATITT